MSNIIRPDFTAVVKAPEASAPKEMLSVSKLEDGRFEVRINSSSLSVIQACPRKAFYTLHQQLRSRQGSPALIFGSAVHKALETFYSWQGKRELPVNYEENFAIVAHGHMPPEPSFIYDAARAFVTAAAPLVNLPETDSRSIQSGLWMLAHYFKTYINDDYEIYRDDQGAFVERTFSTIVQDDPDLRIVLFGTVDFCLRNRRTGEILIGDHKTTSRLGSEFLSRLKPNHQYTGYVLGAQRVFGISSESFLVNGLQVKARPLTPRGGPPTFTRQITRRTPQDIEEFLEALHWAVRQYLAWGIANSWPLGPVDSCANYGGCTFLDVCSAPNALRENILDAKFERTT